MDKSRKILTLTTLFVIILALIGVLSVYFDKWSLKDDLSGVKTIKNNDVLLQIETQKSSIREQQTMIITEKNRQIISSSENKNIVLKDSDNRMFILKEGNFIINNKYISINDNQKTIRDFNKGHLLSTVG